MNGLILASILAATTVQAMAETPAASAGAGRPLAVLAMFAQGVLPNLLDAVKDHDALDKVPVYIGQYGISDEHAKAIHRLPNGRYAPLMTPRREDNPKRPLGAQDLAKLSKDYDGPIPMNLVNHSREEQRLWGLELGRRLRDRIRAGVRKGVKIDSWQFDEISPTPAGKHGQRAEASRWFASGVLHGLCYGRPELKDKPMPGLVFLAHPKRFGEFPDTPGMKMLLWELDHVALALLGEEYAKFQGDPAAAAAHWARGQKALASRGGVRARLAGRYVSVLSPGYKIVNDEGETTHLGGNVDHKPDSWVDDWRRDFFAARARLGATGLGQYSFSKENVRPAVVRGAVNGMAHGIAALRRAKAAEPLIASAR